MYTYSLVQTDFGTHTQGGITMSEEKKKKPEDLKQEENQEKNLDETWAADSQDELEDWIEEQGIQLRY